MLTPSSGTKTQKPQAALRPIQQIEIQGIRVSVPPGRDEPARRARW